MIDLEEDPKVVQIYDDLKEIGAEKRKRFPRSSSNEKISSAGFNNVVPIIEVIYSKKRKRRLVDTFLVKMSLTFNYFKEFKMPSSRER